MKKTILIILLILIVHQYFSQPGPPTPSCWPPPCIPIDGGISVFTLISILFGYKLVSKNK